MDERPKQKESNFKLREESSSESDMDVSEQNEGLSTTAGNVDL